MTNNLLVAILISSGIVSLAGVVLYLTRPLVNRYCSKRLQFYIWMILAIRLLIPFGVSIPIPSDMFSQSTSAPEYEVISNYKVNELDVDYKLEANETPDVPYSTIASAYENMPMHDELSKTPKITLTPYDICLGIICGVAVILFIFKVVVYLKFKRLLMHNAKPIDDDIVLDQFDFIKEEMSIKTEVKLLSHDAIGSPMLVGILRPAIVLPSVLLNSSAQVNIDYVFLHELTHFIDRHIIYKWLLQVVICFHWFNPLAYLICSENHRLCELSCDEAVTQKLSHDEKRAYGDTLLRSMELADAYAYPTVALTLAENAKLIKERLREIMKRTRTSRCASILSSVLAAMIISSTLITGVYAAPPTASDTLMVKASPSTTAKSINEKSTETDSKIFNIDIKSPQASTNGLMFIDLGKRTLTQGQRLLANLYWEGDGALMFLYTKEKLDATSAKKLIDNGILPFVSTESHEISDNTNLRINLINDANLKLNFALNKTGFIGWINDIPDSGDHNFYIIGLANAAITNINGIISPNHNLTHGDKLPRITKWSGGIGEVENNGAIEVNAKNYTGDKINYEFTAKKGDSKTISLKSYLVGSYEVVFTDDDRTVIKAISAFSKSKEITLNDLPEGTVSMRLMGYNVSGTLIVEPSTQVLPVTQQSSTVCEGSVAANLTTFGNPFVANKGDKVTVRLTEDLDGMGLDKDNIKLKLMIGDNDANTYREISLSNKDREFSFVALQSATHWVEIVNDNMQSVNYKFEILTPSSSSSVVSSKQSKQTAQKSNNIIVEGGIAANLTGPASGDQLTVNKGDKITISLAEDLAGWKLSRDSIKVTVMIDDQSVVLSNTDREKSIIANNAGTFTVKIKNGNMQLVNYKFNVSVK